MIRCNRCSLVTTDEDALVCKHCGQPLQVSGMTQRTRSLYMPTPTAHLITRDKHIGKMGKYDIAMYFIDMEDPLLMPLTREVVLGRTSRIVSTAAQPTLDLTPFQGIERGVSREHAALRRIGRDLIIVDLESTNGTWLNNCRLLPNAPTVVQNGDRIVLAKLSIYVYFE